MKKAPEGVKVSEKSHSNRGLKIFLGILIFIFIVGIIATLLIVIQVPYTAQVIYTEKEPSTEQQCDDITLKSVVEWGSTISECTNQICDQTSQVCAEKNFWGNCIRFNDVCVHQACTKYRYYCTVNIQNIDDTAGTWMVSGYYRDSSGDENFVQNVNVYVQPTRTGVASWNYLADAGDSTSCYYGQIKSPTKTKCDDKIVYNEVEKTKEETRYCNAWKKLVGVC